jgi:hypothetical protein
LDFAGPIEEGEYLPAMADKRLGQILLFSFPILIILSFLWLNCYVSQKVVSVFLGPRFHMF